MPANDPTRVRGLRLPAGLELTRVEPVAAAETNHVFRASGSFRGETVSGYLKIADREARSLDNERAVLGRLAASDLPTPRVIAHSDGDIPMLFVESLPGTRLWDLIDPRRAGYRPRDVIPSLRAYGEALARIHALPAPGTRQPRARLEDLIGEQRIDDPRYRDLVDWVEAHRPPATDPVFVHGDFNTANVLLARGRTSGVIISGVIDWEFAGAGSREFELAWALRARTHFLHVAEQREAVLAGYTGSGSFDPARLRWYEVLDHLHFACWSRGSDPEAEAFDLTRAEAFATGPSQRELA